MSRAQATREFVRILRLHEEYPETLIAQVLEEALVGHCYNADGVKQLLLRLVEPPRPTIPLEAARRLFPDLGPVLWPEMGQFDRLLNSMGGEG